MAKIICPNASMMPHRFGANPVVLACASDCPTCYGAGWYKAEAVEVEKVKQKVQELHSMHPGLVARALRDRVIDWLDSLKEANNG